MRRTSKILRGSVYFSDSEKYSALLFHVATREFFTFWSSVYLS